MRQFCLADPFSFHLFDRRSLAEAVYLGDWRTRKIPDEHHVPSQMQLPTVYLVENSRGAGWLQLTRWAYDQLRRIEASAYSPDFLKPRFTLPVRASESPQEKPFIENSTTERATLSASMNAQFGAPYVEKLTREMPTLQRCLRMVLGEFFVPPPPAAE